MYTRLRSTRGLSIIEYAVVWMIVGAAVLGSFPYVSRAMNSFLNDARGELNDWAR